MQYNISSRVDLKTFKYGSAGPVVDGLSWLDSLVELFGGILLLGFGSFILESLLLGLDLFDITADEQINHDVPLAIGKLTAQELDFTGKHPIDHGDRVGDSVVAWDDDVDEVERSIGVAQSNTRDVDIACLNDGLLVALGIGDDDQPWLLELLGSLVGKGTGDPAAAGSCSGTGVLTELVDGTLTLVLGADNLHERVLTMTSERFLMEAMMRAASLILL
jgi:hypothetical protein